MELNSFLFTTNGKVRRVLHSLLVLALFCTQQHVSAMNTNVPLLERQNSDSTISSSRPGTAGAKDRVFLVDRQTKVIKTGFDCTQIVCGLDFEFFGNALTDYINVQENMTRLKFWHKDCCIARISGDDNNSTGSDIHIDLGYTDDGTVTARIPVSEIKHAYEYMLYNDHVNLSTPCFTETLKNIAADYKCIRTSKVFDDKIKHVIIKILHGKLDQIKQSDCDEDFVDIPKIKDEVTQLRKTKTQQTENETANSSLNQTQQIHSAYFEEDDNKIDKINNGTKNNFLKNESDNNGLFNFGNTNQYKFGGETDYNNVVEYEGETGNNNGFNFGYDFGGNSQQQTSNSQPKKYDFGSIS